MAKALVWKLVFTVGVPLFAVHLAASFYSWYWIVPWFDKIMHFWGGVLAALLFYLFLGKTAGSPEFKGNFPQSLVLIASFSALVGVGWEWFEYYYDIFFNASKMIYSAGILADTLGDLFLDIGGGLSLAATVKVIYNYREKTALKK
ncbi:MAG: hypothetical protein HYW37_00310 [Candidatus Colwellbacteria bacterium]|nr:hypothetical protein [Candidatus Colwellbacteria bacterium]